MLEAARGWLTPPVLFVLVNLVIATIAVASRLMSPGPPGADEDEAGGGGRRAAAALLRAPSLAVDRLRASLSFSRLGAADHAPPLFDYPAPAVVHHHHQPQEGRTAGAGAAGNGAEEEVELEHRREEEEEARVERSRSEAAAELALGGGGRRPRARRTRRAAAGEEPAAEVDARADDFIQRFREQLRLQRLDSILRYRDTLRRTGTA